MESPNSPEQGLIVSYAGHYTFQGNAPHPMHEHRGAELVLFTAGRCETRFETEENFTCLPEMLLVIPPEMKHIQYDSSTDCETFYVVFEDAGQTADLSLRLLALHGEIMLQRWLIDIFELCRRHEFKPASSLLTAAWQYLENLEGAGSHSTHPALKPALSAMQNKFREDLSVRDFARECHISVSLLNQLFRNRFGISPRQFLIALRMREARLLLLNPEYNISEVARQTGFNSTNYFIRQFKAFHGITPFRYRLDPGECSGLIKNTAEIFDFTLQDEME